MNRSNQIAIVILSIFISVFVSIFIQKDALRSYFFQDDWFSLRISNVSNIKDFAGFFIPRSDVIYYRPLGMQVPFFIIQKIFGANPFPFHLLVFATHTINILLVFALLKLIKKDLFVSALGAFMYGVSAVHYVSAYWLATYAFVLGPTFFFSSMIFYLLAENNRWNLFHTLSLVAFLLGLITNEMVAVLVPLIILFQVFHKKIQLGRITWYLYPVLFIFIVRFLVFMPSPGSSYQIKVGKEILANLRGYLLWSLNWPEEMKAQFINFWQINPVFIKEFFFYFIVFMITILINLLLLFVIPSIYIIKKTKKKYISLFFFCLIWFIIGLLPVLFFTNHTFSYYLPISLFGFLLFGTSVFRYWIGIIFNKTKLFATILVVALAVNWTISTLITYEFNSKIHWAPQRARLSRMLVEKAEALYPKPSLTSNYIYVRPSSENKLALNNQDAFKVIYDNGNIVTIYYSIWRKIIL